MVLFVILSTTWYKTSKIEIIDARLVGYFSMQINGEDAALGTFAPNAIPLMMSIAKRIIDKAIERSNQQQSAPRNL